MTRKRRNVIGIDMIRNNRIKSCCLFPFTALLFDEIILLKSINMEVERPNRTEFGSKHLLPHFL
jgi:hypothetical protein